MKHLINSVFMLFVLALLAGCAGNNNGQTEIIRKVKIEPVQQADSLQVKQYSGIIKEAAEVNLAFRVAGPIQKIPVKEGDYVRAGQVVAQMDTRNYEVQLRINPASQPKLAPGMGVQVNIVRKILPEHSHVFL